MKSIYDWEIGRLRIDPFPVTNANVIIIKNHGHKNFQDYDNLTVTLKEFTFRMVLEQVMFFTGLRFANDVVLYGDFTSSLNRVYNRSAYHRHIHDKIKSLSKAMDIYNEFTLGQYEIPKPLIDVDINKYIDFFSELNNPAVALFDDVNIKTDTSAIKELANRINKILDKTPCRFFLPITNTFSVTSDEVVKYLSENGLEQNIAVIEIYNSGYMTIKQPNQKSLIFHELKYDISDGIHLIEYDRSSDSKFNIRKHEELEYEEKLKGKKLTHNFLLSFYQNHIQELTKSKSEANDKPLTRNGISPKLRSKILRKYNYKCQHCGAKATDEDTKLEVDHIKPWSKGGTHHENNLQVLCKTCNNGKLNYFTG